MGKRVLLADDSATIQKLVKMALAGTSYELHSAFDGREALKLVDHATPDIVLADAIMPDMDGYQLCEAVKDDPRLVGVPVILLIGRFQPYDDERAQTAGIDDRMIKPFSADQLIGLIEKLLAESEARRPALPEEPEGDLDATVNMTAEELAAHTSHWQQAQTAMTEDIPKIEDIEFDEDVAFDDPVTTDLGDADTMMLEEALEDSMDADVGGPMTMELSTEDLADIHDPVAGFDEGSEELETTDEILGEDDDLEELDESDLLDDSIADFDTELAGQIMAEPVPIEDQDTGPLQEIAPHLPTPNFGEPAAMAFPEPPPLPTDAESEITQPNEEEIPREIPAVPTGGVAFPDDVALSDEEALPEAGNDPLSEDRTTMPNMMVNEVTGVGESAFEESPVEESDELDATVAVSPEWLAANVTGGSDPVITENEPAPAPAPEPEFSDAPFEEEPPLEVDEELPLEESAVEQDALLDDADYEPLSSAIEEPLEGALLPQDEVTDAASDEHDTSDAVAETPPALEMLEAAPVEAISEEMAPEQDDFLDASEEVAQPQEVVSRYDMPTQEVPPPDFDDDEALLEGETVTAEEAYLEAETVNADEAFLQADTVTVDQTSLELELEASEDDTPLEPDFVEESVAEAVEVETELKDALAESLESHTAPEPVLEITEQVISFEEPDEAPAIDQTPVEVAAPVAAAPEPENGSSQADIGALSESQLNKLADMVAERVMRKFERDTIREIAWEVIPELSEAMIKKRIFELEREADRG